MKFIIGHSELRAALQLCQTAVAKRNVIAILSHVRIETDGESVKLATTDSATTVLTSAEALVQQNGACTVEIESLSDIAKAASAPLTIAQENGKMTVSTGKAKYELPTLSAADYPTLPEFDGAESIELSASTILPILRTCSYAAGVEQISYRLSGVLLAIDKRSMDAVACDGHRLALATHESRFKVQKNVFLPIALVKASDKLAVSTDATEVTIWWTDNHVGIKLASDTILHRLEDVNFPNYQAYIKQQGEVLLRFETDVLRSALASVAPFAGGEARVVKLSVDRGAVTFSTRDLQRGTSSIQVPCEYSGQPFKIGFTSRYLSDPLDTIHTPSVNLAMNTDGNSQLTITPDNSNLPFSALHVVMPIRLAEGE